jgi:hypothetical protein
MSKLRKSSTEKRHSFSYQSLESSGLQTTIISCFQTGGCGRCRSSMPWEPFSLRKQGE